MGIFVNQVGYIAKSPKLAMASEGGNYRICDDNGVVLETEAIHFGIDKASGDEIWKIDFSSINKAGKYYISSTDSDRKSVNFVISEKPYLDLLKGLSKCFYFQRCGCGLDSKYAGVYAHDICHTGKSITLKDYLEKADNPTSYDIRGGWHDAGDFGRYSTPGAVALGHLLYAYELFPESFGFELNIPESGNGIPDILNECRYELDWLMQMQTSDGGVYHKHTAFEHADFIMPEFDLDQFILYPVSSMAVADFVAVMCLASRVYRKFDSKFADKALEAARKSFGWLETNDYIGFHNPEGSNTGEYDDECDADERLWAAAEILRTDVSGDTAAYRKMLEEYVYSDIPKTDFGWTDVAGFALLSVLTDDNHVAGPTIENELKKALFTEADRLKSLTNESGFDLFMNPEDFVWGSNMVVLNRGMLMALASMLCDDKEVSTSYCQLAEASLHYILGRNALDRSYVTGFGEKAYRNPHNRTSACDGIDDPMPGWVSGGPFKTPVDPDAVALIPQGTPPMKCQADVVGSYSTNEITIYWNSPAVFVTAYLDRI